MGHTYIPRLPGSPDANSVYTLQQWLFRRRNNTRRFVKRFVVLFGDTIYSYRKVSSLNSDKSLGTILSNSSSRWKISGANVIAEPCVGTNFYCWRIKFPTTTTYGPQNDDNSPLNSYRPEYEDLWFGTPDLHVADDWILAMTKVAHYGSLENWVLRSPVKQVFYQFALPWYLKPFAYLPTEKKDPGRLDLSQNYKNFQQFRSPFSYIHIRIDRIESVSTFADSDLYCVVEVQSSLYVMRLYEQELESSLEFRDVDINSIEQGDKQPELAQGSLISRWLSRSSKQSDKKKNVVLRNFVYPGTASIYIPLFQPFTMHFIHIHFYTIQDDYLGTIGIPETDISAVEPANLCGYNLIALDTIHPLSPKRFIVIDDKAIPKPGVQSTESFYRIPTTIYSDMGIPRPNIEMLSQLDHFGIEQLKTVKNLMSSIANNNEMVGENNSGSPLGTVYVSVCNPRRLDYLYMPAKQIIGSKKHYEAIINRATGPVAVQLLIGNLRRGSKIIKMFINFKTQINDIFHFRDFYKSIFFIFYTIISLWVFPDYLIILTLLPVLVYMITFHPSYYTFLDKCLLRYPVLLLFLPSFLTDNIRIPKSVCIYCTSEKSLRADRVEFINLNSVCNHYYSLYTCLAGHVFSNYGGWDIFERLEAKTSSNYNALIQSSSLYNSFLFFIPPFPSGQLPLLTNIYYTIIFFIALLIITLNGGLTSPERLKLLFLMRLAIERKPGFIGLDSLNLLVKSYDYTIEHQRKNIFGFYSSNNLLSFEPTTWPISSSDPSTLSESNEWKLVVNSNTDDNGWQYLTHWGGVTFKENNLLTFIRKRTWIKRSKLNLETDNFQSLSEAEDCVTEQIIDIPQHAEESFTPETLDRTTDSVQETPQILQTAFGDTPQSSIIETPNLFSTLQPQSQHSSQSNLNRSLTVAGATVPPKEPTSRFSRFREGSLRNLIKSKFSSESDDFILKRPVKTRSVDSSLSFLDKNITLTTSARSHKEPVQSSPPPEPQPEPEQSCKCFIRLKSFPFPPEDAENQRLAKLKRTTKPTVSSKAHPEERTRTKKTPRRARESLPLGALSKRLVKLKNLQMRILYLSLKHRHKKRFRKHFTRRLMIPKDTLLHSVFSIFNNFGASDKPISRRLRIGPLYLSYTTPRILRLNLGKSEFKHYLTVRAARRRLLGRTGNSIRSVYHHQINFYTSFINPSPISLRLKRKLITHLHQKQFKKLHHINIKKKVHHKPPTITRVEPEAIEEKVPQVYRWNIHYKSESHSGFALIESGGGKFFRITTKKPKKIPIKINLVSLASEEQIPDTAAASNLSNFYQGLKKFYRARVKNEESEQRTSVGVFGMFREAKGRVSRANAMIHEYTEFVEKLFNLFTWKNIWVSYSVLLLLFKVLMINVFIPAKIIITIFILLQFKSGYTSGYWDRLLVSHALIHIIKARKKLSINTPFWALPKVKLERLAVMLKKSCGTQLTLSTIRRSHDVYSLARHIANVVSKTKIQRAPRRKNWLSNLILHSPTQN